MAEFIIKQFLVNKKVAGDSHSNGSCHIDDGSTDEEKISNSYTKEQRLYVINRAGTGEVYYLLLTEDRSQLASNTIHSRVWKPLQNVTNFGTVVLNNYLYIIGGYDKSNSMHLRRVLRYDPDTNAWDELCPMTLARSKFGVCAMDGKIYVSGGEWSGCRVTARCEVYDVDTNSWSSAGMLLEPRAKHAVAVYNKELLCAGGYHGNRSHRNLWVYEKHKWCQLDEDYPHRLPCPLERFAVATVNNIFYFVGGVKTKMTKPKEKPSFCTQRKFFSFCTGISAMSESTIRDLITPWNLELPSMIHARHSAGVAVLGNKILIIGGQSLETGKSVNVTEIFDTETGKWDEHFRFRKGDVSNVSCAILEVAINPVSAGKDAFRLKWVMW